MVRSTPNKQPGKDFTNKPPSVDPDAYLMMERVGLLEQNMIRSTP